MYAENLGVVAGSHPREITMPTGSSLCNGTSFFIWITTPDKEKAPGTAEGIHTFSSIGAIIHCSVKPLLQNNLLSSVRHWASHRVSKRYVHSRIRRVISQHVTFPFAPRVRPCLFGPERYLALPPTLSRPSLDSAGAAPRLTPPFACRQRSSGQDGRPHPLWRSAAPELRAREI